MSCVAPRIRHEKYVSRNTIKDVCAPYIHCFISYLPFQRAAEARKQTKIVVTGTEGDRVGGEEGRSGERPPHAPAARRARG